MNYTIHKMLVLLKNHMNYLKDSIFKCFFKEYNRLLFIYLFLIFFSQHIMMESLSYEEEKILKGIRNISRMKKRTKLHCNLRYKKSI